MNRISVSIAAGEGKRAQALALAINEDPRFEPLEVNPEIPVDLQFLLGKKVFNVENKEAADYVISALGKDGHLFQQWLAMYESGNRGMVVVLGDDADVNNAIKDSLVARYRGQELGYQITSYNDRLFDFEANMHELQCPVFRWKASPWKRILSHAHKVLTGGSIMNYVGTPANDMRAMAAANLLLKGFGPKLLTPFLEEYTVGFFPKGDYAKPIEELPGWGPKRCAVVNPLIRMTYLEKIRA